MLLYQRVGLFPWWTGQKLANVQLWKPKDLMFLIWPASIRLEFSEELFAKHQFHAAWWMISRHWNWCFSWPGGQEISAWNWSFIKLQTQMRKSSGLGDHHARSPVWIERRNNMNFLRVVSKHAVVRLSDGRAKGFSISFWKWCRLSCVSCVSRFLFSVLTVWLRFILGFAATKISTSVPRGN